MQTDHGAEYFRATGQLAVVEPDNTLQTDHVPLELQRDRIKMDEERIPTLTDEQLLVLSQARDTDLQRSRAEQTLDFMQGCKFTCCNGRIIVNGVWRGNAML